MSLIFRISLEFICIFHWFYFRLVTMNLYASCQDTAATWYILFKSQIGEEWKKKWQYKIKEWLMTDEICMGFLCIYIIFSPSINCVCVCVYVSLFFVRCMYVSFIWTYSYMFVYHSTKKKKNTKKALMLYAVSLSIIRFMNIKERVLFDNEAIDIKAS